MRSPHQCIFKNNEYEHIGASIERKVPIEKLAEAIDRIDKLGKGPETHNFYASHLGASIYDQAVIRLQQRTAAAKAIKRLKIFVEMMASPDCSTILAKVKSSESQGSRFMKALSAFRELTIEYNKIKAGVTSGQLESYTEFSTSETKLVLLQKQILQPDQNKFTNGVTKPLKPTEGVVGFSANNFAYSYLGF